MADSTRRSLLVNFVYCHPVGHVIEALHYCHGYHLADPTLHIEVALVSNTATELATLCPYVRGVHPIDLDVFDPASVAASGLDRIPTGWDFVADDGRGHLFDQREIFRGLAAYYDAAGERFGGSGSTMGMAGAPPPRYLRGEPFRLTLPDQARRDARALLDSPERASGPLVAVLPAGSGPRSQYPSLASWQLILRAILERFPEATFVLTGKLAHDGRTATSFGAAELDELAASAPRTRLAVDLPIVQQLAVVAECDLLVSPHTGFGMAAMAVGTPWLVIAGNRWPEYYFNGVPFYSVLPQVTRWPAFQQFGPDPEPVDDDGARSPSMCLERIRSDLPEIVEGAARLIERRWPFEDAMADHSRRMLALREGRADLLWSIDGLHLRYLDR